MEIVGLDPASGAVTIRYQGPEKLTFGIEVTMCVCVCVCAQGICFLPLLLCVCMCVWSKEDSDSLSMRFSLFLELLQLIVRHSLFEYCFSLL
jgi:hypothetical protein